MFLSIACFGGKINDVFSIKKVLNSLKLSDCISLINNNQNFINNVIVLLMLR